MASTFSGFGGGSFSLAAPIYIAESCEANIRGGLGSMFQFMLVVGVLFNNGVGAAIDWVTLTGILLVFPGK